MKTRIASLTILCLVLAAVPAFAIYYDNGPINGTTDAWTINFGYVVSDTFFTGDGENVERLWFGVWEFPGDVLTSVDWSITTQENGGTTLGSGTASGHDLTDQVHFRQPIRLRHRPDFCVGGRSVIDSYTKYWLNLQNATVPSGDPVYWDENSGPSMASEQCAVGTIPSEAFTPLTAAA